MRVSVASLLLPVALGLAGGCTGEAEEPAMGSFAGVVEGSDAFVAVLSDGEAVLAYVCDGDTIGDWFEGAASTEPIELVADSGARLRVTIGVEEASGTFTPAGGAELGFTAAPAEDPAGLYRSEDVADGETYRVGWVVLPDGERRGLICGLGSSACTSPTTCSCAGVEGCPVSIIGSPSCSCVIVLGVPTCFPPPPLCTVRIGFTSCA